MTDEDAELAHSLVKQGREWTFDEDDGGEEERAPLLGSDDVAALQAAWSPEIVDAVLSEVARCGIVSSEPRRLVDSACGSIQMGEPVDVAVLRAAVSWP